MLGWAVVGDEIIGVAIDRQQTAVWRGRRCVRTHEAQMLFRQLGLSLGGASRTTGDDATLAAAAWRKTAAELYGQLYCDACQSMVASAERLIIAPHNYLWYLPFELLIGPDGLPTLARAAITYVPTLGSVELAFAPDSPHVDSLVVVNSLLSLDRQVNGREARQLAEAAGGAALIFLDQRIQASSAQWLRVRIDELLVLSQINTATDGWNARVLPVDARPGSQLSDWLNSPLSAPKLTWLPGWESSIRSGQLGNGDDLFLPAAAILLSGGQGMLSRWAAGGISSARYLQRARQELTDSVSLSAAMRRATIALWADQFVAADEAALRPAGRDATPLVSGEHPALWGGYLTLGDRQAP